LSSDLTPHVSIVIPIYNEEAILERAVHELRRELQGGELRVELILAENGSRDRTAAIARELCRVNSGIRLISIDSPNYGKALRAGIHASRAEFVICEEIDLCDTTFHERALRILRGTRADLVIGSKLIDGAADRRPLSRNLASRAYTLALRHLLGFRGTDTHGLKAFRRASLAPIVARCVVDRDVFASELVVRAYRAGLDVREIPVRTAERRPPSVNLMARVPHVLRNLAKLTWAIRLSPHSRRDRCD
jgi:glycosyltransferase involved in cell wall biosynthesis